MRDDSLCGQGRSLPQASAFLIPNKQRLIGKLHPAAIASVPHRGHQLCRQDWRPLEEDRDGQQDEESQDGQQLEHADLVHVTLRIGGTGGWRGDLRSLLGAGQDSA